MPTYGETPKIIPRIEKIDMTNEGRHEFIEFYKEYGRVLLEADFAAHFLPEDRDDAEYDDGGTIIRGDN